MKSPTDAFEDAEIAREELPIIRTARGFEGDGPVNQLAIVLMLAWGAADPKSGPSLYPASYVATFADMARAAIAAGFTRHSPASTTAADAPKQKPHSRACGFRKHDHGRDCSTNCPTCGGYPYRVAAPEGDGGNE